MSDGMDIDDNYLRRLETAQDDKLSDILTELVDKLQGRYSFPELEDGDKRERIWQLLFKAMCIEDVCIQVKALSAVRMLGRDATCMGRVVTEQRLSRVTQLAGLATQLFQFTPERVQVVEEAVKCLCNLAHQSEAVRRMATNSDALLHCLLDRLQAFTDSHVTNCCRLFYLRLLFLLVSFCQEVRADLNQNVKALSSLIDILEILLVDLSKPVSPAQCQYSAELAGEVMKILYGLSVSPVESFDHMKDEHRRLTVCLCGYLRLRHVCDKLAIYVVQALTTVTPHCYALLLDDDRTSPAAAASSVLLVLHRLLSSTVVSDGVLSRRDSLIPILLLLCYACKACRGVRKFFKSKILPPRRDINVRPGQGDDLKNKLIKLMTSPLSEISDLTAQLLFVLCKEDVERLVKYTGYGNAAGLLSSRGLLVAGGKNSEYSSGSDSDTEEYSRFKHNMDPVTGSVEPVRPDPMEGFSEERKLFETEKLLTAIQRSIDSGVIQPCRIGDDGRVHPVTHVMQMQQLTLDGSARNTTDSDTEL